MSIDQLKDKILYYRGRGPDWGPLSFFLVKDFRKDKDCYGKEYCMSYVDLTTLKYFDDWYVTEEYLKDKCDIIC